MEILKFTLSGRTAFFKKPELNAYVYHTYKSIHKVAILGIFGSILGLDGYRGKREKGAFPEFYQKLKDVKVGVKCNAKNSYTPTKIQLFNNTVGYASAEAGGILNVREEWLEKPSWDVYVLLESDISRKLARLLLDSQCVYVPYLGKNDHPADISGGKIFSDKKPVEAYDRIDSLMEKNKAEFYSYEDYMEEQEEEEDFRLYHYEEELPVRLDETRRMHECVNFVATNLWVKKYADAVYELDGDYVVFW